MRLEWIGHVARMDQGRTLMKIFNSKPMFVLEGLMLYGALDR